MIEFKDIELSDRKEINKYLEIFNTEVSELNFTNLFSWREKYQFKYAIVGGFLWISNQTDDGQIYFSPPIGDYSIDLYSKFFLMKDYCDDHKKEFTIKKASESIKNQLIETNVFQFEVSTDRSESDYIYVFDEMLELKGKKYHKKKNRVNKFIKTYDQWSYERITEDTIDDCRLLADEWCRDNNCDDNDNLNYERKAIKEVLDHYEILGCFGGLIRIDGKIAGFTISEKLNKETLVIHFEKGNTAYDAIYNMLTHAHLKDIENGFEFINREQDLGIEGLRRSKLSYHPIELRHKYTLKII